MSDDLLEWARKNHENWLFRSIIAEAGINLTKQGEKIDIPAPPQHDELTEICQLFGYPLYVRLDWRNPEQAKEDRDRIHTAITEALGRTYGMYEKRTGQQVYLDANTKAGEQ